jgi:outer membrane protein assembly factor BamE (lipoprotein component of BamABCDE complex)|tara:strand:- start:50 stop:514 length:465 start_codon:yes stop_codon:yes gene_type:complete
MYRKFYLIILLIFISNCSLNKVVKHHGVHFLDKKQQKLILNSTNKNDILDNLGPPSTESTFDNDVWIYIERKETKSTIATLGRRKLMVNNVLILEINDKGILVNKEFLKKDDMNTIKFSKRKTNVISSKDSFVYEFLSSLRQKINDPLGTKKIK